MASVLENLLDFLLTCPFLDVSKHENEALIYIDYMSDEPATYEIQLIPGTPWIRKYVGGGGVKQAEFVFRSCCDYDPVSVHQNIENAEFYEKLADWLEHTKPHINNWVKVEALTGGYVFHSPESQDRIIYQMNCRIVYTQL